MSVSDSVSDINTLRKNYITRYALGLFLIALFTILGFSGLIISIKNSDNSAYLVNLSGKQRMLSQAIVLDVYRIKNLQENMVNQSALSLKQGLMFFRHRIKNNIEEMSVANQQLSTGNFQGYGENELSTELNELYFGSSQLVKEVDSYLALARGLNKEVLDGQDANKIFKLSQMSISLLPSLDQAVKIYQTEGEQKLLFIKNLEIFNVFLTLIVLLFEALFIFQPLLNKITDFAKQKSRDNIELENQVELRTLKLELANEKLKKMVSHDPLTGVQNRFNLDQNIERIIQQNKKYNINFSVLMIDIDWFKSVNDDYGHEVGDFVLKEVAQILIKTLRQNDLIYRTGGEEFVVLFEGVSLDEATRKAEKIRLTFENHNFEYDNLNLKKTISVGVYHSDLGLAKNVKSILKWVDEALYRSKVLGRNKVTVCEQKRAFVSDTASIQQSESFYLRFDEESFRGLDIDVKFKTNDRCIKPFAASDNIDELLGVKANRFLNGEHCIRELMHPDDFDLVQRFVKTGLKLEEFNQKYQVETLLWESSFRILNILGDVKITRARVLYEPNNNLPSLGSIKLELFESINLHSSFGDSLLVFNFHAMLDNTNDFIYFKDRYHVFTAASKTLVKLTNLQDRTEFVGKTDYDVFSKEYADKYFKLEKQIFSGDVAVAQDYQPFIDRLGNKGWVDNRKYPIKNQDGEIIGLFGIAREITDQEFKAQLDTK